MSWLVTTVVALATVALVMVFILPNPIARLAQISTLVALIDPSNPGAGRIEPGMGRWSHRRDVT